MSRQQLEDASVVLISMPVLFVADSVHQSVLLCAQGDEVSAAALILTFPAFGALDFEIVMQCVVSCSYVVVKYVRHWTFLSRAASLWLK